MATSTLDLWSLVRGRPQIDPHDLADAVVHQAAEAPLDYRTRLLIRDSVDALKGYWGGPRAERWLTECPLHDKIETICRDEYEKVGFLRSGNGSWTKPIRDCRAIFPRIEPENP